mgnify:CR=1 FL=1
MQTHNPPPGELRFIPVRAGRYRLIAMDRHKGIHEEVGDDLTTLRAWLLNQEDELGVPLSDEDAERIQANLDQHGSCHVRSSEDVDLVFVKGGAPRG